MNLFNISGNENTQTTPQREQLTAHEAPLVLRYEGVIDAVVTNTYREIVKYSLGDIAQNANPINAISEVRSVEPRMNTEYQPTQQVDTQNDFGLAA